MPANSSGNVEMTKFDFLRALERELGLAKGSMNENQELARLGGWDSMASLLFIALVDEKLGVAIPDDKISTVKTVNELLGLLGDRLTA